MKKKLFDTKMEVDDETIVVEFCVRPSKGRQKVSIISYRREAVVSEIDFDPYETNRLLIAVNNWRVTSMIYTRDNMDELWYSLIWEDKRYMGQLLNKARTRIVKEICIDKTDKRR